MGPGFKYHVVTVAAVFLALAVGLVVGSVTFSPYVTHYYDRTLQGLKTTLNQDLNDKGREIERLKKGLDVTISPALRDKLNGLSVAIVQTGDYPESIDSIRDTLTLAGAKTLSVTTTEKALANGDGSLDQTLASLHAENPQVPLAMGDLMQSMALVYAHGETQNSLMSALARADLISSDGDGSYQAPVRAVVMLAGSHTEDSSRLRQFDQPLVSDLQKLGIMVVICEPEHAAFSDVPGYQALGLKVATVDDIESDLGKIALVGALLGAQDDFGVKPTAHELLPPLK